MPELPEMDNYKQLLQEKILNKKITDIEINREKSINIPPEHFISQLMHKKIIKITRRAKYLLFQLDNQKILLLHLMLNGTMFYGEEKHKPKRTIQIRIGFDTGSLYFIGLRLGYLHLLNVNEVNDKLKSLGPEPLEDTFTEYKFLKLVEPKRGKIKTTLIDQSFIAGIGNCYSDEICFAAQIKPIRKLNELNQFEQKILYKSICSVLEEAIKYGGYMENPLFIGDSLTGQYDRHFKVYDREGEKCFRCGGTIVKRLISKRKTFFCSNCQH